MAFLSSKQYVHRDIAARNCLGQLLFYIYTQQICIPTVHTYTVYVHNIYIYIRMYKCGLKSTFIATEATFDTNLPRSTSLEDFIELYVVYTLHISSKLKRVCM